jgi:hypothetical protein
LTPHLFRPLFLASFSHQDLQDLFQPFLDLASLQILAQSLHTPKHRNNIMYDEHRNPRSYARRIMFEKRKIFFSAALRNIT